MLSPNLDPAGTLQTAKLNSIGQQILENLTEFCLESVQRFRQIFVDNGRAGLFQLETEGPLSDRLQNLHRWNGLLDRLVRAVQFGVIQQIVDELPHISDTGFDKIHVFLFLCTESTGDRRIEQPNEAADIIQRGFQVVCGGMGELLQLPIGGHKLFELIDFGGQSILYPAEFRRVANDDL